MQQTRPTTTVRTAPAAPIPLWERRHLFVEPVYADSQPYDQLAVGGRFEGEDDGQDAA